MSTLLTKEQVEYLGRYTFISKSEIVGVNMKLSYYVGNNEKFKMVSRRIGIKQLQSIIRNIAKETGVSKHGKSQKPIFVL